MNISHYETIDIETAGDTVQVSPHGRTVVELAIRGDGAASYEVDISGGEGGGWFQNVGPSYSGSADYNDVLRTGATELRVRCSAGTATAGDQAQVLLASGGG